MKIAADSTLGGFFRGGAIARVIQAP